MVIERRAPLRAEGGGLTKKSQRLPQVLASYMWTLKVPSTSMVQRAAGQPFWQMSTGWSGKHSSPRAGDQQPAGNVLSRGGEQHCRRSGGGLTPTPASTIVAMAETSVGPCFHSVSKISHCRSGREPPLWYDAWHVQSRGENQDVTSKQWRGLGFVRVVSSAAFSRLRNCYMI